MSPLSSHQIRSDSTFLIDARKGRTQACQRRFTIITSIVLITLGAIIVGILTLLAFLPNGIAGLGSLSKMGWSLGVALLGVDILALIIVTLITPKGSPSPSLIEEQCESDPSTPTETWTPKITSLHGQERNLKSPAAHLSRTLFALTPQRLPITRATQKTTLKGASFFQDVLQKYEITDLDMRLEEIYGDYPPNIKRNPSGTTEIDFLRFEIEVAIQLITNEEILSLSLNIIQNMFPLESEILFARLVLIDKQEIAPQIHDRNDPWLDLDLNEMTISDLRKIPGNLFSSAPHSFPQLFLKILTASQIEAFLKTDLDPKVLELLFPVAANKECLYTMERFRKIPKKTIEPYLQHLSPQQRNLLPITYPKKP